MSARYRRIPISYDVVSLLLLGRLFRKTATGRHRPEQLPGVNVNDVGTPVPGGIYRLATGPTPRRSTRSRSRRRDARRGRPGLQQADRLQDRSDVPFGTTELEGDLATSWDTSADGLTWTFHLRQGVTFQNIDPVNGREFTSPDVMCTMDAIKARGQQRGDISMISSWAAPDKYTVTMKLGAPYPDLVQVRRALPLDAAVRGRRRAVRPAQQAIGTGPSRSELGEGQGAHVRQEPELLRGRQALHRQVDVSSSPTRRPSAALRTKKLDAVATVPDMPRCRRW